MSLQTGQRLGSQRGVPVTQAGTECHQQGRLACGAAGGARRPCCCCFCSACLGSFCRRVCRRQLGGCCQEQAEEVEAQPAGAGPAEARQRQQARQAQKQPCCQDWRLGPASRPVGDCKCSHKVQACIQSLRGQRSSCPRSIRGTWAAGAGGCQLSTAVREPGGNGYASSAALLCNAAQQTGRCSKGLNKRSTRLSLL